MNIAYTNSQDFSFFYDANVQLEQIINELQSKNCRDKEYGDTEKYIDIEGKEIFRCLVQGWFDIKKAMSALSVGLTILIIKIDNFRRSRHAYRRLQSWLSEARDLTPSTSTGGRTP